MRSLVFMFLAVALSNSATAQQHHHQSPYASDENSGIAAISKTEMSALQNGAGMGLAKAAELNHFPGPKHVLELAEDLNLSESQATLIESIRIEMQKAAMQVGANVIDQERILNRRFLHRHIDQSDLRNITARIAKLRGELRFIHLRAHLKTTEILSQKQILRYDELRGYAGSRASGSS